MTALFYKECDLLIRAGRIKDARRLFSGIKMTRFNRSQKLMTARLARRLGLVDLGLKTLHPIIHPERDSDLPTELERAEFANLLCLNGNIHEALALLRNIVLKESLLAKAWCHFETWDFGPAAQLLRKYVSLEEDPYYFNAGLINLAEALSALHEWDEAFECLEDAITFARAEHQVRLLANALHIRGRAYAEKHQLATSESDLLEAKSLFGPSLTADSFLIHRQLVFNKAAKMKDAQPLLRLKRDAISKGQWESLREIDFQILRIRFGDRLFAKLYFGTPYPKYRERLMTEFESTPPKQFIWGSSRAKGDGLEIREFNFTPQLRMLLHHMLSDFYLPQSIGRIFSGVFTSEFFDWRNSPNKVHQLIARMRREIKNDKLPLALVQKDAFYWITTTGAISLRLSLDNDFCLGSLERLKNRFNKDCFSAHDARSLLDLSRTSTFRLLAQAQTDGILTVTGRGRGTSYCFEKWN